MRHWANDSVPAVPSLPVAVPTVPTFDVSTASQATPSVWRAYASAARSKYSDSTSGFDQLTACHEMSTEPRYVLAVSVAEVTVGATVPASVFSDDCSSTVGRVPIFGYTSEPRSSGTCRPLSTTGRERSMMSRIWVM